MNGAARRARWAVRLLIALAVILFVIAAIGPEVRDPSRIVDFERQNQPPSGSFPLGTDPLGRDNASRVADGVRSSIVFGLEVAALWAGLCVALGLVARQLRRVTCRRTINVIVDVLFTAATLGIAIVLCLDWLDPDAGWFQLAGATASTDYARTVLSLSLYESSVVLFIGVGIAVGIWISRTSLPAVHRLRWGLAAILVLAALAVRAEPFLGFLSVSPVQPPSATIGALIDGSARYSSTGWWMRVPLAAIWLAMMTTFLGGAVVLAARHMSKPTNRTRRLPIYLVAAAWVIALTGVVWRLTARPVDDWAYWVATALAAAGLLGCAALLRRSWQDPSTRKLYLAGIAFAAPLAFDWPLAKLLNAAIPRFLS